MVKHLIFFQACYIYVKQLFQDVWIRLFLLIINNLLIYLFVFNLKNREQQ